MRHGRMKRHGVLLVAVLALSAFGSPAYAGEPVGAPSTECPEGMDATACASTTTEVTVDPDGVDKHIRKEECKSVTLTGGGERQVALTVNGKRTTHTVAFSDSALVTVCASIFAAAHVDADASAEAVADTIVNLDLDDKACEGGPGLLVVVGLAADVGAEADANAHADVEIGLNVTLKVQAAASATPDGQTAGADTESKTVSTGNVYVYAPDLGDPVNPVTVGIDTPYADIFQDVCDP